MCEVGNLIDLTPGEEHNNEETWFEESEDSVVPSNSFRGPYDPFDSMEKEACAKGIAVKAQITEVLSVAEAHYPDLNNESPPVCMRRDSALGETPRQRSTSSSFQKQLLKLNASRSAANLPKSKICDGYTSFERTILNENQQMLSAESPLKLVEDYDMASSLKFEQDLRMLQIPMLDALSDADPKSGPDIQRENVQMATKTEAILPTTEGPPKAKELSQLLQRLRALIHQVVEKSNWHLFDAIIEPLAAHINFGQDPAELNPSASASFPEAKEDHKAAALPYGYTRQGTFDLDLQENLTKGFGDVAVDSGQEEAEAAVPGTKVQDFPDAMTCSAATFDGEPRILAPIESLPLPRKEFMTELMDEALALQLNEWLERHNLGQSTVGDHEQPCVDPRTVILLVNPSNYSSQFKSPPSCIVQPSRMPLGVSSDADSMRRRSSSLSIHDKPKLLKEVAKSGSQDENQQNVPPREVKSTATLPPRSAQTSFLQRRNSFSTPSNAQPTKIGEGRRMDLDRIKTTSINESVVKTSGTTRLTKRVAPIVKLPAAAETAYLNPQPRNFAAPRNGTVPETPFSRSKPAPKIFATSTPLPQMRTQQRRSLKPVVGQGSLSVANASYSTQNFRRQSFSKKPGTG